MPGKGQFKYTEAELMASASRFAHKADWVVSASAHFAAARNRGREFYLTATAHMHQKIPNVDGIYCIYAFEFTELRVAYIGLSQNHKTRKRYHVNHNKIGKLVRDGHKFAYKVIVDGLTPRQAVNEEKASAAKYAAAGWKLLNVKSNLGNLGAARATWTMDLIHQSAKRYRTFCEWSKHDRKAVEAAKRKNVVQQVKAAHFPVTKVWPKDRVLDSITGYSSFSAWSKAVAGAHKSAVRNGWIQDVRAVLKPCHIRWTKQMVIDDAKDYATRTEWCRGSGTAYGIALANKWMPEASMHMEIPWSRLQRQNRQRTARCS